MYLHLQGVVELLVKTFEDEQLKKSESHFVHDPETDALAGRVREIARTALNMSDMEIQEFFDDEASIDHVVRFVVKIYVMCLLCFICLSVI